MQLLAEGPMSVMLTEVYVEAVKLSHRENQVVGEKSDYYITLEQLEALLIKAQERNR